MLLVTACNSSGQQDTSQTSAEENEQAQEQTGPLSKVAIADLEGKPIQLEEYAGKTIVLNFWATWCKPCIVEMPSMVEARASLGDEFVFLLASDESTEKISKFVEKQQIDLPFVQLQNGVQNLQITALPTTWIIRDGKILKEIIGAMEWNTEENIEELKNL
ncbi:TlpA family protein disulfide reductase [Catalinimonas niigatensis]|uniref:TlpA family protein disulfide reductase n=1 Tax=Catalinimonas niigatensis TaxID=1397264 RepID=UPI0026667D9E|nr:TlpA disulfide reductase family protein [Catalinimonas niigatensis]WPP50181.1 TlpA disulfide reductase family protein [Catalinimonas niigatensis]